MPFEKEVLRRDGAAAFVAAVGPELAAYEDAGVTWITIEPTSRSFTDFQTDLSVLSEGLVQRHAFPA